MSRPPRSSAVSSRACWRVELRGAPVLGGLVVAALVVTPVGLWAGRRAHALPATVASLVIAAAALRPVGALFRPAQDGARALVFDGAGSFWLEAPDRGLRTVEVHRASVIRGPWLVLVLRAGGVSRRLVVERSSSQAAELAALRRALRRLAAAPQGPRHALRSLLQKGDPGP